MGRALVGGTAGQIWCRRVGVIRERKEWVNCEESTVGWVNCEVGGLTGGLGGY